MMPATVASITQGARDRRPAGDNGVVTPLATIVADPSLDSLVGAGWAIDVSLLVSCVGGGAGLGCAPTGGTAVDVAGEAGSDRGIDVSLLVSWVDGRAGLGCAPTGGTAVD